MLSPLNLGYAMTLSALLGICLGASKVAESVGQRRFLWAVVLASLAALFLSFTRSAWSGMGLALFTLLFFKPTRRPVLWLGVFGVLMLPVLYLVKPSVVLDFWYRFSSIFSGNRQATSYHYLFLKGSWNFILTHPLGAGLGTATHSAKYFFGTALWTESEILNKGVQCGWFGLISFLAVLVAIAAKGLHVARRAKEPLIRGLGIYIFAATLACFAAGMTGLVWGSWVTSSWYWMLAAIAFTIQDKEDALRESEARGEASRTIRQHHIPL